MTWDGTCTTDGCKYFDSMCPYSKTFPVHPTEHHWRKTIPFRLIKPYEDRVRRNHSQSLERLAQRGGLGAIELYAAIREIPLNEAMRNVSAEDARRIINQWIKEIEDRG